MTPLCGTVPKFHVVDSELEQKYGKKNKLEYVSVYRMEERGLIPERSIHLSPKYREDMLFVVKYLKWDPKNMYPLGYVCKTIHTGNDVQKSLNVLNILHEIPSKEAGGCEDCISEYLKKTDSSDEREDCRELFTLSIDPPGSMEIDDALSIETLPLGLFKVWVHIADVSHFVKSEDAVDKAARQRAMSYYADGFNNNNNNNNNKMPIYTPVHMLPSELATETFSLVPAEDRCAISVVFELDSEGELQTEPLIFRSWVRNNQQMTYEDAQEIIDSQSDANDETSLEPIDRTIFFLHRLAKKLRENRMRRSQFYYDYKIKNFQTGDIGDPFEKDQCHDARRLVEEFMILTNRTVAEYLLQKFDPEVVPVRKQDEPNSCKKTEWNVRNRKIRKLSFFFEKFNDRNVFGGDEAGDHVNELGRNPTMINGSWEALKQAVEDKDARKVRTVVGSEKLHPVHALALNEWFSIQELPKFVPASSIPSAHFDLQIPQYVHFTSPLRRYMDLVVHRLVTAAIDGEEPPYSGQIIQELCDKLNYRTSFAKSRSESCRVLKMADLLDSPFYVPCFVEKCDHYGIHIQIPFFHLRKPIQQTIKYSSFNIHKVPKGLDNHCQSVELAWEKRLYDTRAGLSQNARSKSSSEERLTLSSDYHAKQFSQENWKRMQNIISNAADAQNLVEQMRTVIEEIEAENQADDNSVAEAENQADDNSVAEAENQADDNSVAEAENQADDNSVAEVTSEMKSGLPLVKHHVRFSLPVRRGSVLNVQFGRENVDGFLQPTVRLINLTEQIDICAEHRLKPVKCFASVATEKTTLQYENIRNYQERWLPILHMESATNAATYEDTIICHHVPIKLWKWNDVLNGQLELNYSFCEKRDIKLFVMSEQENETHDYLCIRYRTHDRFPESLIRNVWVCHAVAVCNPRGRSKTQGDDTNRPSNVKGKVILRFRVRSYSSEPPKELFSCKQECTVEFLYRTLPDKRMAKALESLLLPESSELCRRVALGLSLSSMMEPKLQDFSASSFHIGGVVVDGVKKFYENNESQEKAIRTSLSERFTLVQGPPGTGKTLIGVNIAYWFVQMNLAAGNSKPASISPSKSKKDVKLQRKQVLFCGPSNSAVDVVAKQLITRLGNNCPKLVRVYSGRRETLDYPIPRDLLVTKSDAKKHVRDHNLQNDNDIKKISLHRIIRQKDKPHAEEIQSFDRKFKNNMKTPEHIDDEEVKYYQKLVSNACTEELKNYEIILCTCSASSCQRLIRGANVAQIIIDEGAMCKEPESLIPLVTFPTVEQIVLIGDHQQLQPIIKNHEAKTLGLNISLFERYVEMKHPHFVMLDTQYRMNEKICEFPSKYFYDRKLKTAADSKWFKREDHFLEIWPNEAYPMVFCHVEGVEKSQPVSSAEGNEDSKSNGEEVYHVLRIVRELKNTLEVREKYHEEPDKHIAILSQYRAQCSAIKDELSKTGLECDVSTVVASQGSEWDYVVLSTVRSLPEYEIDKHASDGWCMRHLGFICDPHQINVALTRARMGLIIIGNKTLLRCDKMWKELLKDYEMYGCIVNAKDFLSKALIRGPKERHIKRFHRTPPRTKSD